MRFLEETAPVLCGANGEVEWGTAIILAHAGQSIFVSGQLEGASNSQPQSQATGMFIIAPQLGIGRIASIHVCSLENRNQSDSTSFPGVARLTHSRQAVEFWL